MAPAAAPAAVGEDECDGAARDQQHGHCRRDRHDGPLQASLRCRRAQHPGCLGSRCGVRCREQCLRLVAVAQLVQECRSVAWPGRGVLGERRGDDAREILGRRRAHRTGEGARRDRRGACRRAPSRSSRRTGGRRSASGRGSRRTSRRRSRPGRSRRPLARARCTTAVPSTVPASVSVPRAAHAGDAEVGDLRRGPPRRRGRSRASDRGARGRARARGRGRRRSRSRFAACRRPGAAGRREPVLERAAGQVLEHHERAGPPLRRSRRARTMFGCDSAATARASRSNRGAVGARREHLHGDTARRAPSSWASQTALIAPRPRGSSRPVPAGEQSPRSSAADYRDHGAPTS